MLFIVGLERFGREEKEALLAQLIAMSGGAVVLDRASKEVKRAKNFLSGQAGKLIGKVSSEAAEKVHAWNEKLDWNAEHLAERMEAERRRLQGLTEPALTAEFKRRLAEIARTDEGRDETAVACAIVHEASAALEIDGRLYADVASLEGVVFEKAVKEMLDQLKERLGAMTPEEITRLEALLREELGRLSAADRETIRQALGVEVLSAEALLSFLRTASAATIAQMVAGSLGFGVFLFLTTMIKAFSLLIGVTLPFVFYTTATAAMSVILSLPFLIFFMALAGGWVLRKTNSKLDRELAKLLLVIGRARLLQEDQASERGAA